MKAALIVYLKQFSSSLTIKGGNSRPLQSIFHGSTPFQNLSTPTTALNLHPQQSKDYLCLPVSPTERLPALVTPPIIMPESLFAILEDAHKQYFQSLVPRLKKPALNAICENHEEYEDAQEETRWNAMTSASETYRPARKTFFEDPSIMSAHRDRQSMHAARFYVYRHGGRGKAGGIDFAHMWASVSPTLTKKDFPKMESQCVELEVKTNDAAREAILHFVAHSIVRTGGLARWRQHSRPQDRYKVFEAGYDELPEYCDIQVLGELGKSVCIRNIHAVDTKPETMDKTDARHAYRRFNKVRFLINCEAAYFWLLERKSPNKGDLFIARIVWMTTPQHPQIKAIDGLSDNLQDVPGRPFGIHGERDRQRVPVLHSAKIMKHLGGQGFPSA